MIEHVHQLMNFIVLLWVLGQRDLDFIIFTLFIDLFFSKKNVSLINTTIIVEGQ